MKKQSTFKYKNLPAGCVIYTGGILSRNKKSKKSIFMPLFIISLWCFIAVLLILLYCGLTIPNIDDVMNQKRSPSITIVDRNNYKITAINNTYGNIVDMKQIPTYVWQAIVATEDKRFFTHYGIDPIGLIRAIYRNLKSSNRVQGGSTITQQLAKNIFLSREKTIKRKIQELLITFWLEYKFTKDEILSSYLNRVSLVSGKYGISIAAENIFGKTVNELNIAESAILAGMLRSPTRYNPKHNKELSLNRMKVILKLMYEQNYITKKEYETALLYDYIPVTISSNGTRYFTDYVMDSFDSVIGNITDDIIITTTLDLAFQQKQEKIIDDFFKEYANKYNFSQIATITLNRQGEIIGMIGGKDYSKSQFNRAIQMKRQPGSTFKPFVYLAGLEYGLLPDDIFVDKPVAIGNWSPKNNDGKYIGTVTMEKSLQLSLNTIPVQIGKIIGLDKIIYTAKKLGLVDEITNDFSIILGTSSVSLVDITSAFAVFSNNGYGVLAHPITKITTVGNKVLYERKGSGIGKIIEPGHTINMNKMLKGVIREGTGQGANIKNQEIYGKTGTSQDNRDAWFVGYNKDYITGIWLGNDDYSKMSENSYGGTIPAKIFKSIMSLLIY